MHILGIVLVVVGVFCLLFENGIGGTLIIIAGALCMMVVK